MTHVLAAVRCLRCTSLMYKQGGKIYFCPVCKKYFRLKGMVPICVPSDHHEAMKAMAQDIAEEGILPVCD